LEEVSPVRTFVETNGQSTTGYPFVEVAVAFNKKMGKIIIQWRAFLFKED